MPLTISLRPGPDQAGEAEDFALASSKETSRNRLRSVRSRTSRMTSSERSSDALLVRVEAVDDAPDHRATTSPASCLGDVHGRDVLAVAENRDPVAIVEDLHHAVGDVDDRDALTGQLAHDLEQDLRLALGQRGGRLVEDQHAAVERQRLGDLDQLLLRDRERRAPARRDRCRRGGAGSRLRVARARVSPSAAPGWNWSPP